ncbi:MAG: DNA mismatch repair protein MutS [Verrucomicrobia bacterium]|nr:MAG: DNA mismatch repair protein MutS [Verrucomicrobiota bacterium]
MAELQRLRPAEVIYPGEAEAVRDWLRGSNRSADSLSARPAGGHGPGELQTQVTHAGKMDRPGQGNALPGGWILNGYEDWVFGPETAVFTVREHFKVAALDGFGLKEHLAATGAAGGVLHYLTQHLRRDGANLTRLSFYQRSDFLALDHTTLRHLEILEPLPHDAPRTACLYGALNRTVTPMGARRLRNWLSQPLASMEPIRRRQEVVQAFVSDASSLESFRTQLTQVRDLERTLGRLSAGTGNGRDLQALRLALEQVPALKQTLKALVQSPSASAKAMADKKSKVQSREDNGQLPQLSDQSFERDGQSCHDQADHNAQSLLAQLESQLTDLPELVELISKAIVDEPPLALKEGGLIRDGFDAALDELRVLMRGGKDWIAKLQQDEIARTGIQSLKVRFNSVFGYYIEVTKANLDKVPAEYVRKQTIAGGERFITPELKAMESKILGAEERSLKLEYDLFQRVREEVLGKLAQIQDTAGALAQLDVLASFAETARLYSYCCPQVADEGLLSIRDGRHPVLEQSVSDERFVPNDAQFGSETQIALITGPNMAGKSTYIRQVALLTLLAHTGSFVPAAEARIDLVDRIFTRIGASDDLARGQSTFMVEMCETANLLNNATPRSLIILDEIGRGTSTFDGLSLAWAIVEHLHNQVGAKTLFATHYHELSELAARLPRLKNYNVAVREWRDQIVFLRKIVEGGTDKSYGIQVARLAGVPRPVLDRAKEILRNLEDSELTPEGTVRNSSRRQQDRDRLKALAPAPQMDLFG